MNRGALMSHARALVLATCLAISPMAFSVAISASTGHQPIWVPTHVDVKTIHYPGHCRTESDICTTIVTTTVPAHYVIPDAPGLPLLTTAQACSGNYYMYPSVRAQNTSVGGNLLVEVDLSAENWYNGCSAGAVWVDGSCTSYSYLWGCSNGSHGGFWDSGNGFYQDWTNWNEDFGALHFTMTVYLRIHVYPNGTWARWCYENPGGSC